MDSQNASTSDAGPISFQTGDQAPLCYGVAADGAFYSSEQQRGRASVLLLIGARVVSDALPLLAAASASASQFAERDADLLLIVDQSPAVLGLNSQTALPAIDCGPFLRHCAVGPDDVLVLVLDRNMRVALKLQNDEPATIVGRCLESLDLLPREAARRITQPAPVIVLPNLLPPAFCANLINLFDTSPTMDGEVARVDAAGVNRSVVDHAKKRRRDMPIGPGHVLHDALHAVLLDRCARDIARAYQARMAHIDRLIVARYDESAGWFRRHRDNAAPNVAFREFAFSISLNAGAYDGGDLLFPEYNDHRYSPPTGGAVIFSASLLHEVTAVTRGQRYVLLGFMHGEAAEARRQAYLAREASGANEMAQPTPVES